MARTVIQVIAPAGAGKTEHLTNETKKTLGDPSMTGMVLAVTFTREAAGEMKHRLGAKNFAPTTLWVGTIDALALRILRESGQNPSKAQMRDLIKDNLLTRRAIDELKKGFRPLWGPTLRYLAVDEAQDLNAEQAEILGLLLVPAPSATVLLVGDPWQSIYSFRGANPGFLQRPETWIPGPVHVEKKTLGKNYRSAKEIVKFAEQVAGRHVDPARPERHQAVRFMACQNPADEAACIMEEIMTLRAVGVPASDIAILTRTRKQFEALRQGAQAEGIATWTPPLRDTVDEEIPDVPRPPDSITIGTIHSSKGRGWTVVFLAGCQEGFMPYGHQPNLQEETNLMYVGLSRARQLLWVSHYDRRSRILPSLIPGGLPVVHAALPSPESQAAPSFSHFVATPQRAAVVAVVVLIVGLTLGRFF